MIQHLSVSKGMLGGVFLPYRNNAEELKYWKNRIPWHHGAYENRRTFTPVENFCFAVTGVAKVGGWLHLLLYPERLWKLTENYVSSNEKIKKAHGVEKMPV